MSDSETTPSATLPHVASRAEFVHALTWLLRGAITRRARVLHLLDRDFSGWPLDEPECLDLLQRWLQLPQRKLVMVAADWSRAAREHARFNAWRVPWSHGLDTRLAPEEEHASMPSVMFDDGPLSLQLLDRDRWLGRCSDDPRDGFLLRQQFDALVQRSTPDFPPTTLGL